MLLAAYNHLVAPVGLLLPTNGLHNAPTTSSLQGFLPPFTEVSTDYSFFWLSNWVAVSRFSTAEPTPHDLVPNFSLLIGIAELRSSDHSTTSIRHYPGVL